MKKYYHHTNLDLIRHSVERLSSKIGKKLIITGHRRNINTYFGFPSDMEQEFQAVYDLCQPYTMTSLERMYAIYEASLYISRAGIDGDIVCCGVWKGGSAMVIAASLNQLSDTNRHIYLYDTFAGMTEPTKEDIRSSDNRDPWEKWHKGQRNGYNEYAYAPIEEVKANLKLIEYPADKYVYIKGKVEETIPAQMPLKIALLRIDTDWYNSTKHQLIHLYPQLVEGGVLYIDDYGHFTGAKKAVNEYFLDKKPILLNRVDYSGRMGIKP